MKLKKRFAHADDAIRYCDGTYPEAPKSVDPKG